MWYVTTCVNKEAYTIIMIFETLQGLVFLSVWKKVLQNQDFNCCKQYYWHCMDSGSKYLIQRLCYRV